MDRVGLSAGAGLRLAMALAVLALAGCASTPDGPGTNHIVRPGENLYRISRYYGVDLRKVIRANRIRDVTNVAVGQEIFVPGATRNQPAHALLPGPGGHVPQTSGGRELAMREADLHFAWPVQGRLSSGFGWRSGRRHEGIDICAKRGTAVRAAEAGRVIYSAKLGDYGNVVIVKHAGRYSTVYAHNKKNRVRKGAFVEKGDVIAEVGRTGNASGSHVHFEVRRDRVAQDPMRYLPEASRTAQRR
jgi:murein DD-endopeptidase MepM/ murein hydrolase activator NlpD